MQSAWKSCLFSSGLNVLSPDANDNPYVSFADPFADAAKGDEDGVQDGLVHIRIQQRNNRKTLTTIQGLSSEYDLKKIVRACKKVRKELPFYLTRAG